MNLSSDALDIGTLHGSIVLEDQFSAQLAAVDAKLRSTDAAMNKLDVSTQAMGTSMVTTSHSVSMVGMALSAMSGFALAAAGAFVKMSIDFNRGMADVATLIPDNIERVRELGDAVQAIAVDTGKTTTDVTRGLYQIISALGDTADTAKILEINTKAAIGGFASTLEAVNLTTNVMLAYNDKTAEAAQKAADLAFETVRLGKTTFPELAAAIGKAIPLAAQLGITQEELFASFSALSGVTGDTSRVSTQLTAVMRGMIKPTEGMTVAIHALGFESAKTMLEQLGMAGSLNALKSTTDGSEEAMAKLYGRMEALSAVFALTGNVQDRFNTAMEASKNAARTSTVAYEKVAFGVNKLGHYLETWQIQFTVWGQKLGNFVQQLGPLGFAIGGIGLSLGPLTLAFQKLSQTGAVTGALSAVATAMNTLGIAAALAATHTWLLEAATTALIAREETLIGVKALLTAATTAVSGSATVQGVQMAFASAAETVSATTATAAAAAKGALTAAINLVSSSSLVMGARMALASLNIGAAGTAASITAGSITALGVAMGLVLPTIMLIGAGFAGWKLGQLIGQIEVFGASINNWVPILWNWKLGLNGLTLAELKLSEAARDRLEVYKALAAQRVVSLKDQLTGLDQVQSVSELTTAYKELKDAGQMTPDVLKRVAEKAIALRDAGAQLNPILKAITENFEKMNKTGTTTVSHNWVAQLEDAQARLARMTPEVKKNLQAAFTLGETDPEKLFLGLKGLPGGLDVTIATIKLFQDQVKSVTKETAQFTKELNNLKGVAETRELMAINTFWKSMPDAMKSGSRELDLVLKQYMELGPKLHTIPDVAKKTVEELNAIALNRGMFSLPMEEGIKSAEGLGQAIGYGLLPNLKRSVAETMALEDAFTDLLKMESQAGRGIGSVLSGFQMRPEDAGAMTRGERSIEMVIAADRELQDLLRDSSLDTTSIQVANAIRAGQVQRAQLGLTKDAYAAIDQNVVTTIAKIIAAQDNWTGTLEHVKKQLELVGIAIPEEQLRELLRLMEQNTNEAPRMSQGLAGISSVLGGLAQGFVNLAQVSDGAMSAIARSIGQITVSFDNSLKSFVNFKDKFINPKTGEAFKGVGAQMALGIGAGLLEGLTGIFSAPTFRSTTKTALSTGLVGAAGGAAVGGMLATAVAGGMSGTWGGIWGAVAGFAIGAIVGIFKGRETRRIMHDIGRDWGTEISEGLAETIKYDAENVFKGSRDAATIFNMDKIIEEGGGLNTENFAQRLQKLRDVFVMLGTGQFDVSQATSVLDRNFRTFVDFIGEKATPAIRELIRLNDINGTQSKVIADYTTAATNQALTGIGDFIGARGDVLDALVTAQEKLAKATGKKEIAEATAEVEKLKKQLEALPLTAQGASGIGAALFGAFERLTKNSVAPLEAIRQIDPLIESMDKQLQAAGLTGGAAFDKIREMAAFATDEIAGPTLTAISGLGSAILGLNNADILTPEMFSDLSAQVTTLVGTLKLQGKTNEQIYPFVAAQLQTIWELHKDTGYAINAETEALLKQAEADGVVGEAHRSVQEKMLMATEMMRDAILLLVEHMGVDLPDAMREAARTAQGVAVIIEDEFDINPVIPVVFDVDDLELPRPGPITVPVNYDVEDVPTPPRNPKRTPAELWTGGIVYAAEGRVIDFKPKGTDVVPAMLTPNEGVMNVAATAAIGADRLAQWNANPSSVPPRGGSETPSSLILVPMLIQGKATDQDLDAAIDHLERAVPAIKGNTRGLRTKWRKALGIRRTS